MVVSEVRSTICFLRLMYSSMQAWRNALVYSGFSPLARSTKMVVRGRTVTWRLIFFTVMPGCWFITRSLARLHHLRALHQGRLRSKKIAQVLGIKRSLLDVELDADDHLPHRDKFGRRKPDIDRFNSQRQRQAGHQNPPARKEQVAVAVQARKKSCGPRGTVVRHQTLFFIHDVLRK